ncbi:polysaccharide pyruvyl transferase family protein [Haloechinothrix sp. LS1_15]|uniref:polysaccharide pyruvyl transferase family protein n=1 Tax=Haloechinothrix sp. LS1_15 TaxID=2652248 RepID=UPI002945C7C8|nr:polysaccharide pyruvyl transferase family protein [Haloechinothrix sp. LS1_15]MDV6012386.1 polysaccharide pyruvyl transferase family protein [Haloechinothrix sp. LS1_15]
MPLSSFRHDNPESPAQSLYYLVTPAGFPNFGDDLIAAAWLEYLAEHAPHAEVWLDTHSPGQARVLLDGLHPGLRVTDTLWQLSAAAPSSQAWQLGSWVQAAVENPGMVPRLHHGIMLLWRAEVVHVLGGGYINALWPRHIGLLAGVAAAVRRSGGRAAMTGHGLLPVVEDGASLLTSLAGRFDIAEARDAESAGMLGIEQGVDDAFLAIGRLGVADVAATWPDGDAPDVFLCVQGDLVDEGVNALAGRVWELLQGWRVAPERVCFVEGIPGTDREVFALLERELPGARFYPFADVWDSGLPAAPGQTWISTRFHVHLMAAAAGAAGVAVPVKPGYYTVKHRSLVELGSGWHILDGSGGVVERPSGAGFATEDVARLRQAKLDLAKRVYGC